MHAESTATYGADYTLAGYNRNTNRGTIRVPRRGGGAALNVNVVDDKVQELEETFVIEMVDVSGSLWVNKKDNRHKLSIAIDDNSQRSELNFDTRERTLQEGHGADTHDVRVSLRPEVGGFQPQLPEDTHFEYCVEGTATPGSNYEIANRHGTFVDRTGGTECRLATIPAGQTTLRLMTLRVLSDSDVDELPERVTVRLKPSTVSAKPTSPFMGIAPNPFAADQPQQPYASSILIIKDEIPFVRVSLTGQDGSGRLLYGVRGLSGPTVGYPSIDWVVEDSSGTIGSGTIGFRKGQTPYATVRFRPPNYGSRNDYMIFRLTDGEYRLRNPSHGTICLPVGFHGVCPQLQTQGSSDDTAPPQRSYAELVKKIYEWRNDPRWKSHKSHTDRWDRALLAFGESVEDASLQPMSAAQAQVFADRGMSRWVEVAKALHEIEAARTAAVEVPATQVANVQVAAVDATSATVTWDAVEHATSYRVEYESAGTLAYQGNYVQGASNGHTGTSWTFTHNAAEAMTLTVTVTPEVREDGNVQRFDDLARTATIDVAPADTQDTDPQTVQAHSCDLTSVKAAVAGYVQETHYGAAHVARWEKALAGLNEEAGGMTAAGARQMMATYSPGRWQPVVDALDCLEAAAAAQPETPAVVPEIAVSGGNGIAEGGSASFTVTATPAPSSPLAVTLTVGQSGDYAASGETGTRQVTVPTGGSMTFEVATADDGVDEPDGSVSATVEAGTGYTVGGASTASVAVADDDDPVPDPVTPELRLSAGSPVDEGGNAVFTVHADQAPAADLTGGLTVSQTGDVLSAPGASSRQLTLAAGTTSATLALATDDDGVDEPDGSVSVTLDAGAGYTVAAGQAAVAVAVRDNDEPVVSIAAGVGVTEGTAAAFTLTANPAPHAALTVSLAVTQSGDYAASGQTGTRNITIPTGGSIAFEVATENDSADEPDGSVTATLAVGSGYAVAASPDDAASVAVADDDVAAVPEGPSLSVNDVEVKEGPYRRVEFTVTLSEASRKGASFHWRVRESDPVSARRNKDFVASARKVWAFIRPGETETRVRAALVLDDSHDEDPETFEIVLSDAHDAAIADGVGVATIVNDDPMPAAFLSRFGRTVAEQALDGIANRIAAPREAGAHGTLAGQSLSFGTGSGSDGAANDNAATGSFSAAGGFGGLGNSGFGASANGFGMAGFGHDAHLSAGGPGPDSGLGLGESRTMTGLEALLGSSFTATGEQDGSGGSLAFWGRAAQSSFDGREGTFSLDGETTTAMLGADYARGNWLVGLALMQSSGEGGYVDSGIEPRPASQACPEGVDEDLCNGAVRTGDGDVEASLTAAVPYAAIQASERLRLWGAAGYGTGEVTLKPEVGGSLSSDISWTMAAAGARSDLLPPPMEGSGPTLALTSDALWARTSSEKTHELAASDSDVTRLRVGLEGGYAIATEGGGRIVPKVEIGARHDGGDAETGFGVELGGGIAWTDPAIGLSLDLSGRTLIAHGSDDLEDQGFAASLAFDPNPGTERGLSLSLTQDWGGAAQGGLDALFATDPLADRAGTAETASRWQAEAAYGLPAFSGRFTGSPHVGLGLATGARDYTLGWRLSPAANANVPDLSFGVKATRRESDTAAPEHTVGFELRANW